MHGSDGCSAASGGHPSFNGASEGVGSVGAVAAPPKWKPVVLVVDDSAMNRKMLTRMLNFAGFAFREAEDGVEALSEVSRMGLRQGLSQRNSESNLNRMKAGGRSSSFPKICNRLLEMVDLCDLRDKDALSIDAIIIDSNMPRMGGPEAIVEMRKIGFKGPIVGVSGGDGATLKEFLTAGADAVLQKPAKTADMIGLLKTGLLKFADEELAKKGTDVNRREHCTRMKGFLEQLQVK